MKYGVCDWVFGDRDDAARFARAATIGFDGIEVNLELEDLADPGRNKSRLEKLAALAHQHSLKIPSLCIGEHNAKGLVADPSRSAAVTEIRTAIDCCARLGAATLLVPFFSRNEPRNIVQRRFVAEKLRDLCGYAAAREVVIAYEGTLTAAQLGWMAHEIGSPAFGVYFDLANVVWVDLEGPKEIRELAGLIRQVHMKDTKFVAGDVRPGQGRVNHAESIEALRQIGYEGWMVLETPAGSDEEFRDDLMFTKRLCDQH